MPKSNEKISSRATIVLSYNSTRDRDHLLDPEILRSPKSDNVLLI